MFIIWGEYTFIACFLISLPTATLNDIQYPVYRVAFKFRKLQKNFLRKENYVACIIIIDLCIIIMQWKFLACGCDLDAHECI